MPFSQVHDAQQERYYGPQLLAAEPEDQDDRPFQHADQGAVLAGRALVRQPDGTERLPDQFRGRRQANEQHQGIDQAVMQRVRVDLPVRERLDCQAEQAGRTGQGRTGQDQQNGPELQAGPGHKPVRPVGRRPARKQPEQDI